MILGDDPLWFPNMGAMVCDPQLETAAGACMTERHVQCVWADPALRPRFLETDSGEQVEIVFPGRWNLEAGPDFLGAELRFPESGRVLRGDVEIHIRPGDWTGHRHTGDPRYASVVAHVTWFTGKQPESLSRHICCISLRGPVSSRRDFSFDMIDVSAYPHRDLPETSTPCHDVLKSFSSEDIRKLLSDAGKSRLRRKSAGMAAKLLELGDVRQVFFEEFCGALGYRDNAVPFRETARRLSYTRFVGYKTPEERLAALLAAGGLLEQLPQGARERAIWDLAWKMGVAFQDAPPYPEWKKSGMRPVNRPVRRAAVAAAVFDERFYDDVLALSKRGRSGWWKALQSLFADRLAAVPEMKAFSGGLGKGRIASIAVNVIIPVFVLFDPAIADLASEIPGETVNSAVSETAYRLFGRDFNRSIVMNSSLCQQGLLEIWTGFCLQTRGGCSECGFAKAIKNLKYGDIS